MKKWMLETKLTYRQWVSLAVFVSCVLGLLVYMSLAGVESSAKGSPQVELVKVVVAKQDIPERAVIKENMLKVVDMPVDVVPENAVRDVSDVVGSPASTAIWQGDILTTKKVYTDVRMAGFTGTIPPNCRAVSVAITDITGVSGFCIHTRKHCCYRNRHNPCDNAAVLSAPRHHDFLQKTPQNACFCNIYNSFYDISVNKYYKNINFFKNLKMILAEAFLFVKHWI